MQDRNYASIDDLIAEIAGIPIEELGREAREKGGPRLITRDELLAAGALDVPPAWRKSLGGKRDPSPRLFPDDDSPAEQQQQAPGEPDGDASADGA